MNPGSQTLDLLFHTMLYSNNSSFIEGDIMRVREKRIDEIITKDKYQAHLVESVIRQMIDDNKTIHVVVEEMEAENVEANMSDTRRVVPHH